MLDLYALGDRTVDYICSARSCDMDVIVAEAIDQMEWDENYYIEQLDYFICEATVSE